jgi:hypothetical protein
MKSILLILAFVCRLSFTFAQSITLDPNSLQLPRLSANPACAVADKGKLIYNTAQNKILFCNGSTWVDPTTGAAPNNWVNAGNNAILANGKVSIGTVDAPTATLDINGNLRIRGNSPLKGSTLVSIDDNGTLNWQKPYAFRVDGLVNTSLLELSAGQTVVLPFRLATYNIGAMYSTNPAKFVAPVKGIYHIDTHVTSIKKATTQSDADAAEVTLMRKRNTTTIPLQFSTFSFSTTDDSQLYGPTVHHSISGDFLLEAGDEVWVRVHAEHAQIIDGMTQQTSFCGRLVLQMF